MKSDCEVMVNAVAGDRGNSPGIYQSTGMQYVELNVFTQSQYAKNDCRIKQMLF